MRLSNLSKLLTDRRGATAIEYGLIAALISLACIIAFVNLGLSLTGTLNTLTNAMKAVTG
jgi:pilus assembly protein Flp/PilA